MITIIDLVYFIITGFLLALSPGPDIFYVFNTSLLHGKKKAIGLAFGLSSGLIFHSFILAYGISKLIVENDFIFLLIKIFGTVYLGYIIFNIYQNASLVNFNNEKRNDQKSVFNYVAQGLIMNLTNPKIILFFLSIVPSFLKNSSGNTSFLIYTFGSIFMLATLFVFISVAYLAYLIKPLLLKNQKIIVVLNMLQIGVLAFIIGMIWV